MDQLAPVEEDCSRAEVRLRPVSPADAPAIAAAMAQRDVAWMLSSVPHPYPPDGAERWLGEMAGAAGRGSQVRAVEHGGLFAGIVALEPHPESGGLELGYWIAPRFWGRGLATAAAGLLVEETLGSPGTPGVWARVAADNPASARVLGKLGFDAVGQLDWPFVARGATVPCRIFWRDRLADERPVLETARLVLNRPCAADIPRLVDLAGDRDVAVQTSRMPHPYGHRDAEEFLRHVRSDEQETVFALRLKGEHGALIGCTGFMRKESGEIEIGYWLGRPYWGEGLATEAARAVIDLVFCSTGVPEIHAAARVTNRASRRVLEKCGFQVFGTGLIRSRALGGSVPVDHLKLDRRTWESLRAWRPAIRRGRVLPAA